MSTTRAQQANLSVSPDSSWSSKSGTHEFFYSRRAKKNDLHRVPECTRGLSLSKTEAIGRSMWIVSLAQSQPFWLLMVVHCECTSRSYDDEVALYKINSNAEKPTFINYFELIRGPKSPQDLTPNKRMHAQDANDQHNQGDPERQCCCRIQRDQCERGQTEP